MEEISGSKPLIFFSSIIVIMSRDSEEEYFELGNLHGEDVKKLKKEEDEKSYEYLKVKVRLVAQFNTKCPC